MDAAPSSSRVRVDPGLARRLHRRARADRWNLSLEDFSAALVRSVTHRFRDADPSAWETERYLASLHLEDLALAAACARGRETAWEHFVRAFRPALLAAAASAPPDVGREIADSIYADLFGLEAQDGVRRSLFDYFHGRSSLAGWLRAVLAQRVVDWARTARRFDPLPEEPEAAGGVAVTAANPPDVDRPRLLALVRGALAAALAGLAPRDRLRLALYYTQQLKLAAVGRALGESEATASRKLERTRRDLRAAIERRLREQGLAGAEVEACFDYAQSDSAFDLDRALPVTEHGEAGQPRDRRVEAEG